MNTEQGEGSRQLFQEPNLLHRSHCTAHNRPIRSEPVFFFILCSSFNQLDHKVYHLVIVHLQPDLPLLLLPLLPLVFVAFLLLLVTLPLPASCLRRWRQARLKN